jgi:hypothetical protein
MIKKMIILLLMIVAHITLFAQKSAADSAKAAKKQQMVLKSQQEKFLIENPPIILTKEQVAAAKKTQDSIDAFVAAATADRQARFAKEAAENEKLKVKLRFEDSLDIAKKNEEAIKLETEINTRAVAKNKTSVLITKEVTAKPTPAVAINNAPLFDEATARKLQAQELIKKNVLDKEFQNIQKHIKPNELDVKEFSVINQQNKTQLLGNTYVAKEFNKTSIHESINYRLHFVDEATVVIYRNENRTTAAYTMPSMYCKINVVPFGDEDPVAYNCEITKALELVTFVNKISASEIQLLNANYQEILKLQKQ